MRPYENWLDVFRCGSFNQLYFMVTMVAKERMGLDGLPFPLSALEHPSGNKTNSDINSFIYKCYNLIFKDYSEEEAIKLVEFLKNNPPEVSYGNPKLPETECTKAEDQMMRYIIAFGLDLPGSKNNANGLGYFTDFFIDMYFGNYTEFMEHINNFSAKELEKALDMREGYCKFSPLFAPILGLRMVNLDGNLNLTTKDKHAIKRMYNCCNENKHVEILKKLLELGADPNAHDIYGSTPLLHAVVMKQGSMVKILLENGADPNSESRNGKRALSLVVVYKSEIELDIIEMLMNHNVKFDNKDNTNEIRSFVESYAITGFAVRVRKASPRSVNECEKCMKHSSKMCSACGLVYYCSPACQKLDWKFHKVDCHKKIE